MEIAATDVAVHAGDRRRCVRMRLNEIEGVPECSFESSAQTSLLRFVVIRCRQEFVDGQFQQANLHERQALLRRCRSLARSSSALIESISPRS